MASETDLAWAAGIIDGEGSIFLIRSWPGVNRRTTLSFQLRVTVRMTHEQTVRRMHALLGGVFKPAAARDPNKHKACFEWFAGDRQATAALKRVAPYLTTKREQADLVLAFRARCFGRTGNAATTPALAALRLTYYQRLKQLNRKGPA